LKRVRSSLSVCPALVAAVALGCGGRATGSKLEVEHDDGGAGAIRARASWTYLSPEVDVHATLVTEAGAECFTTASLVIDTATSGPETYRLEPTACSLLELRDTGDIVLYASPTGHDWSTETLRVDTERELIELGPWTPPEAGAAAFRFTLAAPACGGGCSCPFLRRRTGDQDLVLELARDCD
jgi:hypothetical protein